MVVSFTSPVTVPAFLLSLFALKAERDFYVQIFKMALHHSKIPINLRFVFSN